MSVLQIGLAYGGVATPFMPNAALDTIAQNVC